MFQKILVALDHSDSSNVVFEQALSVASTNQSNFLLVHILSPLTDRLSEETYSLPEALESPEHAAARERYLEQLQADEQNSLKLLQTYADRARARGIESEIRQTLGDVGRTICWLASQWDADLIVIGRHRPGGRAGKALGSASNYVTWHTSCSVLIVQV